MFQPPLQVVEETGALCMVAFQRRFDPTFQRLQQSVAKGEIGDVHMIHITSRDPGPPPVAYIAQSGGLHCDMAIHDFDMARFITGSDIVEVFTKGDCKVDPAIAQAGDIDTSLVVLKFANGVLGTVSNSRKARCKVTETHRHTGTDRGRKEGTTIMPCLLANGPPASSSPGVVVVINRRRTATTSAWRCLGPRA